MQHCLIFHNQSRGPKDAKKKEAGARNEKYGRQKVWTPDSKAKLGAHK